MRGSQVDDADLVEACRYLSHIGVWPGPKQFDIEQWLQNFDTDTDRAVALALLESYVHINEEQIAHAVCSTVRSISTRQEFGIAKERQANWDDFVANVMVSFPLGGSGDSTASGYIFARIAKQLGLPDDQIRDPEHLVPFLAESECSHQVIFLDDLAASGTQFTRNWVRQYPTNEGPLSLAHLQENGALSEAYYLPVVSTWAAKKKIETNCKIPVLATYLLEDDYCALAANTRLVPDGLRDALPGFLDRYGPRTGNDQFGPAGFGGLGLALSFHHGSPNNTVPILQWGVALPDWNPLVLKGI